jgi:hypothetical protein
MTDLLNLNILIPGLGGSKIYCCCNEKRIRIYPKKIYNLPFSINKHFFDKGCKSQVKIMKKFFQLPIYSGILNLKNFPIIPWAYDWRRPVLAVAKEFYHRLLDIQSTGKTINLIGHSNGGFIIRVIIEYFGLKNIANVFICSTPLYGSMDPLSYFNEDILYRRLACKKQKCPKISQMTMTEGDIVRSIKHFRETLIFLCPTYRILLLNEHELATTLSIPIELATTLRSLHLTMSKIYEQTDRPVYNFYFNQYRKEIVGRNKKIVGGLAFNACSGDNENLFFSVHTDATIVSKDFYLPKAKIYYDKSLFPHAMNMNSGFLLNILKN